MDVIRETLSVMLWKFCLGGPADARSWAALEAPRTQYETIMRIRTDTILRIRTEKTMRIRIDKTNSHKIILKEKQERLRAEGRETAERRFRMEEVRKRKSGSYSPPEGSRMRYITRLGLR